MSSCPPAFQPSLAATLTATGACLVDGRALHACILPADSQLPCFLDCGALLLRFACLARSYLAETGSIRQAVKHLQPLRTKHPASLPLMLMLGHCHLLSTQYAEALSEYFHAWRWAGGEGLPPWPASTCCMEKHWGCEGRMPSPGQGLRPTGHAGTRRCLCSCMEKPGHLPEQSHMQG